MQNLRLLPNTSNGFRDSFEKTLISFSNSNLIWSDWNLAWKSHDIQIIGVTQKERAGCIFLIAFNVANCIELNCQFGWRRNKKDFYFERGTSCHLIWQNEILIRQNWSGCMDKFKKIAWLFCESKHHGLKSYIWPVKSHLRLITSLTLRNWFWFLLKLFQVV